MQRSTILIVEDDPLLRADTVSSLEDAGLSVIDRADADEALGFLLENGTDVAAVLTDINMPGHSDGVHLAEMISRHWPHIGVVVTTGGARPVRDLPARVHFIPKPGRAEQAGAAMQGRVVAALSPAAAPPALELSRLASPCLAVASIFTRSGDST